MGKLDGRSALITGGSRGIGRAIALRFASEGAQVGINDTSNEKAAAEVVNEINDLGMTAHAYQADVADETATTQMIENAIKDFGQVDIFINNAGLGSAASDRPNIADATNNQWSRLLDVNLWGPIYLCRGLVPHMRSAPRSDIVMLSSIAAQSLLFRLQSSSGLLLSGGVSSQGYHTMLSFQTLSFPGVPCHAVFPNELTQVPSVLQSV